MRNQKLRAMKGRKKEEKGGKKIKREYREEKKKEEIMRATHVEFI